MIYGRYCESHGAMTNDGSGMDVAVVVVYKILATVLNGKNALKTAQKYNRRPNLASPDICTFVFINKYIKIRRELMFK